eukprot:PITA_09076
MTTSYFKSEDKLKDKSDYHAWKMTLDLTLEENDVMDYIKGRVVEPPSNALIVAKTKYTKGEVKAKKIIVGSIQNHLVAYIFDLETSKEMYDKLVGMFKVNNANQILFLKNKLKDIKMDKGKSIQSYFMRITEIKNDLLPIREVVGDRKLTLIALGGLTKAWDVFNTTILNNHMISGFDELLARCTQEEIRMMERDKPSNGNDPTAFFAHDKRKNNVGPRKQGPGFKPRFKEGRKGGSYNCNRFSHYARDCPHKKDTPRDDDNKTTTTPKEMAIKRTRSSTTKEREMLPQLDMEMVILPKDQEIIDNATYPVKGIGNVTLHLNQGQTIHLQEVLYLPHLKTNMVSIFVMEDKGFKVAFIDGKVRLSQRNPKDAFTLGFRVDGLYQVGGSPLGPMSCNTSLQSELWHQRFSHLHYKALPGVKKMATEAGIMKETIVAYTPEQNGVVERKNRTIMKATYAMLHDLGLPKFLWGEAANIAIYVQNRCQHQALNFKTPEEVFTSKNPDVSHFRTFGCPVYFHVPKEKRNKLGECGKK